MNKIIRYILLTTYLICLAIGQLANARELYSRADLIDYVNKARNNVIELSNKADDSIKIIDYRVGQGVSIEIDARHDYKKMPIPKNQKKENYLVESTCINIMLVQEYRYILSSLEYMKFNIFNKDKSFETSFKIDYELCNSLDYRSVINPNTGKFTRSYIQNKLIPSELVYYEEEKKNLEEDSISIQNIHLGDGSSMIHNIKLSLNAISSDDPVMISSMLNDTFLKELCEVELINETIPFFHNAKLRFLDYIELKFYNQDDNTYITSVILDTQVCKLE
jgi:hypothetical protein